MTISWRLRMEDEYLKGVSSGFVIATILWAYVIVPLIDRNKGR